MKQSTEFDNPRDENSAGEDDINGQFAHDGSFPLLKK